MLQTIVLISYIVFIIGNLVSNDTETNDKWFEIKSSYTSAAFGLFLISYIYLFILLVTRLKRKFPNFFESEKRRIYLISSLIIIGLIAKILF
jgi:hypothetical protein